MGGGNGDISDSGDAANDGGGYGDMSSDEKDVFYSALFASFLTLGVWAACFYRAHAYCRDLGRRDQLERAILESRRREINEFNLDGGGIEMGFAMGRTPNTTL